MTLKQKKLLTIQVYDHVLRKVCKEKSKIEYKHTLNERAQPQLLND